jgi:hypothetical protein
MDSIAQTLNVNEAKEVVLDELLAKLAAPETAIAFAEELRKREAPFDLDKKDRIESLVRLGLPGLIHAKAYGAVFALLDVFDRLQCSDRGKQRLLRDFLTASMLAGDNARSAQAIAAIPGEVIVDGLAYNLACHAARAGDRPRLLLWARKAVEMGKHCQQFMQDTDFHGYRDDPAFLEIIRRAIVPTTALSCTFELSLLFSDGEKRLAENVVDEDGWHFGVPVQYQNPIEPVQAASR